MKMPLLATLFADAEWSTPGESPRLHDLISGLLSGSVSAGPMLDRLDPDFADEVRAFVAHRGLTAENFLANALLAFALDIADQSWRQSIKNRRPRIEDPEAEIIADLLAGFMRQRRDRQIYLPWPDATQQSHVTMGRRRS